MQLELLSYHHLIQSKSITMEKLENTLHEMGIVGIKDIPGLATHIQTYTNSARQFSKLSEKDKGKYAPNKELNENEGYELGAERFKDKKGHWQIDDKKASFYAFVPDNQKNKWPIEVDLKTAYLPLGQLIFNVGKLILESTKIEINFERLTGYGRMLHYQKIGELTNHNPLWCGAHVDHGLFTGLIPAVYFNHDLEVDEPKEAGLYVVPSQGNQFEKVEINDKNTLLFQVGEFGQLISNDRIKATRHCVKKATGNIERYSFALFYSAPNSTIHSTSILTSDPRYQKKQKKGMISYEDWEEASYATYRANTNEYEVAL